MKFLKKLTIVPALTLSVASSFATADDIIIDSITGSVQIIIGGENTLMYKRIYQTTKGSVALCSMKIEYPNDPKFDDDNGNTFRLENVPVDPGSAQVVFPIQEGLKPTDGAFVYTLKLECYGPTLMVDGSPKYNLLFATNPKTFTIESGKTTKVSDHLWLNRKQNVVLSINDPFILPGTHTLTYLDGQEASITVNGVMGDSSLLVQSNDILNPPLFLTNGTGNSFTLDYDHAAFSILPVLEVDIVTGKGDVEIDAVFSDGQFIRSNVGLTFIPNKHISSDVSSISILEESVLMGDYKFVLTIDGVENNDVIISTTSPIQAQSGLSGMETFHVTTESENLNINFDFSQVNVNWRDIEINVKMVLIDSNDF